MKRGVWTAIGLVAVMLAIGCDTRPAPPSFAENAPSKAPASRPTTQELLTGAHKKLSLPPPKVVTLVPTTPLAGVKLVIVGGLTLDTVTVTAVDVLRFPAASRAMAVSECEPLLAVVVSHETEYGAVVSSAPRFAPSNWN